MAEVMQNPSPYRFVSARPSQAPIMLSFGQVMETDTSGGRLP